jgi:hypothetical protein
VVKGGVYAHGADDIAEGDGGPVMQEMRTWLDAHRFEMSVFHYRTLAAGEAMVEFKFANGRQASAFTERFNGTVAASP